jgi:hypothetical protein
MHQTAHLAHIEIRTPLPEQPAADPGRSPTIASLHTHGTPPVTGELA